MGQEDASCPPSPANVDEGAPDFAFIDSRGTATIPTSESGTTLFHHRRPCKEY